MYLNAKSAVTGGSLCDMRKNHIWPMNKVLFFHSNLHFRTYTVAVSSCTFTIKSICKSTMEFPWPHVVCVIWSLLKLMASISFNHFVYVFIRFRLEMPFLWFAFDFPASRCFDVINTKREEKKKIAHKIRINTTISKIRSNIIAISKIKIYDDLLNILCHINRHRCYLTWST